MLHSSQYLVLILATVFTVANASGHAADKKDDDKLHYVFQLTRHGARAPMGVSEGFSVEVEQLTPSGMRQRYLLGAYNRQRYSVEYDLLDLDNDGTEQILMSSTLYNRTMQSGYSELMGMLQPDPKTAPKLTRRQEKIVMPNGAASPPFQVRDQIVLNAKLKGLPLPDGFSAVPIFNHNEQSLTDDLDLNGCDYVDAVDGYRFPNPATYTSVDFLTNDLREPFTAAFNLTQYESENMTFMQSYHYCDIVQSNEFEGLGTGYDYTPDQLKQINQTVLATLILPMNDPVLSRQMYVSKQLRMPLTMMMHFVDAKVDEDVKEPKIKFLTYSTHDWTVAQMLLFFEPDFEMFPNFEVLPFASQLKIELHSTKECKSESCFWVEVIYNGANLSFEDVCEDAKYCTYPEFMQMLQFRGFVNTSTYYEEECAQPWSPTDHDNSIPEENFSQRQSSNKPTQNIYERIFSR